MFCLCFPQLFSADRRNPRSIEGKNEGRKSGIQKGFLNYLRVKKAGAGRHFDGTVPGLCLVVQPSGSRSWVLRLQRVGKRRDLGLGGFPDVGLEEARDKARALRKLAATGADLIAARDKERVIIPSFREAAEACHKARERGWAPRHAKAFLATLELHAYSTIGKLRVDSVDEKDIVAVLSPLWQSKPAAARKIRHPSAYGRLKADLVKIVTEQRGSDVAQAFVIRAMTVDPAALTSDVTGTLKTYVGAQVIASEDRKFRFSWAYAGLRLSLTGFEQTPLNDKPEERR